MAVLYLGMGLAFTYIASQAATDTIWNTVTILLSIVATFNIAVAIRLILFYMKLKQKK